MDAIIKNDIKALRKAKGLNQQQLADKMGLKRQAVSNWERFKSSPSLANLLRLSEILGVSIEEITKEAEIESPLTKQDIKEAVKEALLESQVVICPLAEKHKYRGQ